ncbi:MAG TPA: 2OG-Fe(II) oxygenase [Kofleriaceae bacterium]|nr:2OG-Fe(II) oxygenase [Kofleriaceae bacterium]
MITDFLPSETFIGRLLPGLIQPERCTELIAQLTQRGFAPTGDRYPADYRNNDRLVFEDPGLATELAERLTGRLPDEIVEQGSRWRLVGLNPRFRACRYEHGQAFCIHRDGAYVPDEDRRSFLTVQVYLDADPARVGGCTRFYADPQGRERWASIAPARGSVIAFDHRVWHDGEAVTAGIKHVLRTDAIYERVEGAAVAEEPDVIGRHRGYAWSVIGCRDGTLASCGRDGVVRRWPGAETDLRSGSVTTISEAAELIWCGTRAGVIATIGRDALPVDEGLGAVLDSAAGGALVVFSTARGEIRAYSASTRSLAWTRQVHEGWAWSVASHRGGFVSCGHDGRVQSIDAHGRVRTLATLDAALRVIASAGERLEVGDERGWIHTVGADGAVLAARRAHAGPITALAPAADGSVFSSGEDGVVKQWRGMHGTVVRQLRDYVTSLAVVGDTLVVAGYDGAIRRVAI